MNELGSSPGEDDTPDCAVRFRNTSSGAIGRVHRYSFESQLLLGHIHTTRLLLAESEQADCLQEFDAKEADLCRTVSESRT